MRWLGLGVVVCLGFSAACGQSEGNPGNGNAGGGGQSVSGSGGSSAGQGGVADGGSAGEGSGLVSCDPKKIACKRLPPQCAAGEVPSVSGTCYGDCVKIDRCACSAADDCPDMNQYTCWAKQHCGPYVQ